MLIGFDGAVRALACAVGVGVADKTRLENRRHHGAQRMMHDPVAEGRGGNKPLLRLLDQDFDIAARPVGAVQQRALKPQQLAFQIGEKTGCSGLFALAQDGFLGAASLSA